MATHRRNYYYMMCDEQKQREELMKIVACAICCILVVYMMYQLCANGFSSLAWSIIIVPLILTHFGLLLSIRRQNMYM